MRKALVLCSLLLAATTVVADEDEVSRSVSARAPRGAVRRVVIDIPAGELRIANGEANALSVEGKMTRNIRTSKGRAQSQKIVDDTDVEIVVNGDTATIQRRLGPNARGWRARNLTAFDLKLELPEGVDLNIGTSYGIVRIEGRFGAVHADLTAGEIEFRTPRKNVGELNASARIGEVHTDLGDRVISREGILPGRTHFVNATGNGLVNLHVTTGTVNVTLTR